MTLKSLSVLVSICAIVFGTSRTNLGATIVVDQSNLFYDADRIGTYGLGPSTQTTFAQTFTVGINGQLVGVDLGIYVHSSVTIPLMIDIANVVAGMPDFGESGRLATQVFSKDEVPPVSYGNNYSLLNWDLSGFGLQVARGDQLAIVMRADNHPYNFLDYYWRATGGHNPTYPFGSAKSFNTQTGRITPLVDTADFDFEFRTFVAIPEVVSPLSTTFAWVGLLPGRRRRRVATMASG